MPVSTLNGWTSGGLSPSYATVAHILGDSSSHFHPFNIPGSGAGTPPGAPTTTAPGPGQYQGTQSAPTGPVPVGQAMSALGQAAFRILGYNPFAPKPKPLTSAAGATGQIHENVNPALLVNPPGGPVPGSNIPPAVSGQTGFLNLNPQFLQYLTANLGANPSSGAGNPSGWFG